MEVNRIQEKSNWFVWLVLWCLTPLSIIFQLYRSIRRKPLTCHKLYLIMLYTSPRAWFALATSVVIGTHCTGSCQSNYHTITITTVPVHSLDYKHLYCIFYVILAFSVFQDVCDKLYWWRRFQKRMVHTKFDIYIKIAITVSIPLLVHYKSSRVSSA